MQVDYHAKYLKYKQKYLDLKEEMIGSGQTLKEMGLKNPKNEAKVENAIKQTCGKMTPADVKKTIALLEKKGFFTGPSIDASIEKIEKQKTCSRV
jgi:hypothetical protein